MTVPIVIGAGQAGLAVSHELRGLGVEHVVLERARVAQSWRGRWDSFTLVTPNWTLDLPGAPYSGGDPEGHVPRDEIVAYLLAYAAQAPVREGVDVVALRRGRSSRFTLDTSDGPLDADVVAVCTGAYQRPFRPDARTQFAPGTLVIDSTAYRNPDMLPAGTVLIVGSGQTGCQLAEELHLAGRDVVLACGRAPWIPRRLDGLDAVTWMARTSFFDQTLDDLPSPAARLGANVQSTGAGGGHDLHFRTLQSLGVALAGRLAGADGRRVMFADDLAASVAFGDERWLRTRELLRAELPRGGYSVPELPEPEPFRCDARLEMDAREIAVVIFTSGFRPDYSWIDMPIADEMGFPLCVDGVSTVADGLHFCGVHFMRCRRSSLLFGVGEDAKIVARAMAREAASAAR